MRVLDVPAALSARRYSADGRLVLQIRDALGFADGTWELTSDGGVVTVNAADGGSPDLSMDVTDLGSVYLGAVNPVTLASAGRIREHTPGAALAARHMFAVERPAHCLTHF
ncbi:sterol carrier protein domain-containing protein [Arthrobacter sp. Hiyo1]|uniref:sterol carrier protein domain-containing protein n=1 Tax=Arthrobacter sp. Hiyo1 TaxID=1588020 RepID=UPI0030F47BD7